MKNLVVAQVPRYFMSEIQDVLSGIANPTTATVLRKFFKTGSGEYGEGDLFRGIRAPTLRKLAVEYQDVTFKQTEQLLHSMYHEDRLLALFILIRKFDTAGEAGKKRLYKLYLRNTRFVNNWDLVDSSAAQIAGAYLYDKDKHPLFDLAGSENLWDRRIAIIATYFFIRRGQFDETLKISKMLLADREDLIHKAVGWMLREIGKRDMQVEEEFLRKYCAEMPRTSLRYAIEKFSENKRRKYLSCVKS